MCLRGLSGAGVLGDGEYGIGWLFFVKQKTAYEMRISDWSSDVCSSDLSYLASLQVLLRMHGAEYAPEDLECLLSEYREKLQAMLAQPADDEAVPAVDHQPGNDSTLPQRLASTLAVADEIRGMASGLRSEEHTSELQSLMRISYAVFC